MAEGPQLPRYKVRIGAEDRPGTTAQCSGSAASPLGAVVPAGHLLAL